MTTQYIYLPGNVGQRAFIFPTAEGALRHADERARQQAVSYSVKVFSVRAATAADAQVWANNPEVDTSVPESWVGRIVPIRIERVVTVPRAVQIKRCSDPMMWYAGKLGQTIPIEREDSDGYWAREGGDGEFNPINIIRKTDAALC